MDSQYLYLSISTNQTNTALSLTTQYIWHMRTHLDQPGAIDAYKYPGNQYQNRHTILNY